MSDEGTVIGDITSLVAPAKEPWLQIVEDIVLVALPAVLGSFSGPETVAMIAAPSVVSLLQLAEKAVTDLAAGKGEAQVRKDVDDAIVDLVENIAIGPKP